jgi:hemoglobin
MISIYEEAGGDEGLTRLARAWHNRVLADPIVGHAFEHGFHPDHTRRLGAYWAEALGGPARYTQALGSESMVVRMHSGNGVHTDMDERAIECFEQALVDTGITHEPLRTALLDYFVWATNSMTLYPRLARRCSQRPRDPPLVVGRPDRARHVHDQAAGCRRAVLSRIPPE